MAKYRAELNILKATADPKQAMLPYSTKSSQKCTKWRAQSALPESLSKRKAVIIDLAADYDIHPVETGSSQERPPPMNKITDDIRECVHDFYFHSDNCWMAPGHKGYFNVVRDGQKMQVAGAEQVPAHNNTRATHTVYWRIRWWLYQADQLQSLLSR